VGEEDSEEDDDKHNNEPQRKLNGATRKKKTIRSMQGKENGRKMTGRENKAISPAGRTSARRSMNESKRTANSQELVGSLSKRRKTRALIPSLSSRFCSPDFPSLKKRGQCDDMS
jgi:hypothetical protein